MALIHTFDPPAYTIQESFEKVWLGVPKKTSLPIVNFL